MYDRQIEITFSLQLITYVAMLTHLQSISTFQLYQILCKYMYVVTLDIWNMTACMVLIESLSCLFNAGS